MCIWVWVPIEVRRECRIPWVWWLSPWQVVVSAPIHIKVLLASELSLLTPPHKQYFTSLYQEVPASLVRSPSVGFLSQACWSVGKVSWCGQVLCKRSHAPPAASLEGWQSRVSSLDGKFSHVCMSSSSSHHSSALSTFSRSAPPDHHIPPKGLLC